MMCYMEPCVACEIKKRFLSDRKGAIPDVSIKSKCLGRNPDQEPHRRFGRPDLGHVRHLRGRLHRHVRDRQVGLSRPRGHLSPAVRRHHHRRREDLPGRLLPLQHHGHRGRRPRHRGRQRQGHLPGRQPGGHLRPRQGHQVPLPVDHPRHRLDQYRQEQLGRSGHRLGSRRHRPDHRRKRGRHGSAKR